MAAVLLTVVILRLLHYLSGKLQGLVLRKIFEGSAYVKSAAIHLGHTCCARSAVPS